MNNKVIAILNEASLAPKRFYTLYFYYRERIKELNCGYKTEAEAIKVLDQILDLNIDKDSNVRNY